MDLNQILIFNYNFECFYTMSTMKYIFFILSTLFIIDTLFAQPAITVQIHRPKIRVGQTTPVLVTAHGLRDLVGANNPAYSLRITLDQPAVAAFGIASSSFTAPLDWAKVSPQGTFVTELSVTGLRTGAYSITADLVPGGEEMFAAPEAVAQDEECCEIEISWHVYKGSKFENAGTITAGKNKVDILSEVAEIYEDLGICITWIKGKTMPKNYKSMSINKKSDKSPGLEDFETASGATKKKPEVMFTNELYENDTKPGVTINTGGNVSALEDKIPTADLMTRVLAHELGHIFGLEDYEFKDTIQDGQKVRIRSILCPFMDGNAMLKSMTNNKNEKNIACFKVMLENCEDRVKEKKK